MKVLVVEDYEDFQCVGDQCPISCCGGGWTIAVDKESVEYYRSLEGEFGDKLRASLNDIGDRTLFQMDKNGDCVFLDDKRLCEIYKHLGPDKMCHVCKTYPRYYYQVGDILFCYLTNSCPEATRRILQRQEPLQVLLNESGLPGDGLDTDWNRFNFAIRAYTAGMDLLQNRDLWVQERLALLLLFVSQFQDMLKTGKDPSALISAFSRPEVYFSLLNDLPIYVRDYRYKIRAFAFAFRNLLGNAREYPMWRKCKQLADCIANGSEFDVDALAIAFDRGETPEMQIEMEQLLTYRFFAVFMRGYEKNDYYEQLAYECNIYAAWLTYIALSEAELFHVCTQEERIEFYSLISRTDHDLSGKDNLTADLKKESLYEMANLFRLIS